MKEAVLIHINNFNAKAKMAHKKVTFSKVVANSRHSVVTPEQLSWILDIGLYKANQMIIVTNQCVICTVVHPIRRRYRTDHLDIHFKYISGRWYVDWMPAATKPIT